MSPRSLIAEATAKAIAKAIDDGASGGSAGSQPVPPPAIPIPPPVPTERVTPEQLRASLERGLAEARAGRGEDFDVVQARLRAKFFPPAR